MLYRKGAITFLAIQGMLLYGIFYAGMYTSYAYFLYALYCGYDTHCIRKFQKLNITKKQVRCHPHTRGRTTWITGYGTS